MKKRKEDVPKDALPHMVAQVCMHETKSNKAANVVAKDRSRGCTSSSPSTARSIWPLRQDLSKQWILLVLVDMMHPDMSATVVSQCNVGSKWSFPYLCKLSGRGYLCSLSGQNGQTYPGDSWTRPCLIISFFRLKPLPPSLRAQPFTGQKCGLADECTFACEFSRYWVWKGAALQFAQGQM
jgi:hypothetical protein